MITQELVQFLFDYNPETGIFIHKNSPRLGWNGRRAGSIDSSNGYRKIMVSGSYYKEHRIAWLYMNGCLPDKFVDHINGIRDDNRISNIRTVSGAENQKNQKRYITNKSGVPGVCWRNEKWVVRIGSGSNGKRKHLGCYSNIFDAACARKSAEREYGFHENHGRR